MIQHTKRLDRTKDEITAASEKEQTLIQGDGTDLDISPIAKHLMVLGMASRPNSRDLIGAAVRLKSDDRRTLIVPLELLGTNNKAGVEEFLLRSGMCQLLDEMNAKDFGTGVRRMAKGKQVVVISDRGYQKFFIGGSETAGYAWQNKFYRFGGEKSEAKILLTDDAAVVSNTVGDVESWNKDFRPFLIRNPRMLVAVCFTLAAAIFAAFGLNGLVLALIAMSSQGKSTILRLCASMIGDWSRVIPWFGTGKGVQERLTTFSDQPSLFDDMHKADEVNDVIAVGMNVGNAATRLLSSRVATFKGSASKQIRTYLLLSSEEGLFALARHGNISVNTGLQARYFEIHAGPQFGMFDDLCGHTSGSTLSKVVDQLSKMHCGAIWTQWIAELSKRWDEVTAWHTEMMPDIRTKILDAAGNPECDAVTDRMIDSLTFAAFAGCLASKLEILKLKPITIIAAFGQVVKEHIERQPQDVSIKAQEVVDAVRGYVQSYRSSFLPLDQYGSPDRKVGVPGFIVDDKKHGPLILFLVEPFRQKFEKTYGVAAYQHLRDADFLVAHPGRHNRFTKRVGEASKPVDFIAIKADIEYVK